MEGSEPVKSYTADKTGRLASRERIEQSRTLSKRRKSRLCSHNPQVVAQVDSPTKNCDASLPPRITEPTVQANRPWIPRVIRLPQETPSLDRSRWSSAQRRHTSPHRSSCLLGFSRKISSAASQTLAFPNLITGRNLAHNSHTSFMWSSMTNRVKVKIFQLPSCRPSGSLGQLE